MLAAFPQVAAAENLAPSQLAPLNFKGLFSFGYGGVAFGKAGVEIRQDVGGSYAMTTDIASTGIVNVFIKHSSHTTVDAKGTGFPYDVVEYDTHYQTKGKKKAVHMVYKKGEVVDETALPPDNRSTRPAVTKASKDQSLDPLSLVMAMRQSLYEALKSGAGQYSLYLYDGRRFSQINFNVIGLRTVHIGGADTETVLVDVSRKLLEGYTASELEDGKQKEPPLHVYFTHDERLLPLLFEAPLWLGSVRAYLTKECGEGESCLLGIRE